MGDVLDVVPPDPHGHQMAGKAGPFFSFVDFMFCITVAKRPCFGPLKFKPCYIIVHYYIIR
jgi:hypothetical protein